MSNFLDDIKPATIKQIRKHYADENCEVRITRDGHVRFRSLYRSKRDTNAWREGRYVEQYHVDGRGEVHLI